MNRRERNRDGQKRLLAVLAKMNYMESLGNLSMEDYVTIYGELPPYTVLKEMTQEFIKSYHTLGVDSMHLVDGYGLDWVEALITHNEELEEYELCTLFRDLIIEYKIATLDYLIDDENLKEQLENGKQTNN